MLTMILGLAAAAFDVGPTPPAETRTVALELREGERLFARPSFQVRVGEPAGIATAGDDGYGLSLVLEHVGEDYLVRSAFYRPAANGWRLVAQPALQLEGGALARTSFTDADGRALSISFRVR